MKSMSREPRACSYTRAFRPLLTSLCCVVVVSAYDCSPGPESPERGTWYVLEEIANAVESYRSAEQRLPYRLADLCPDSACPFLPPGRGFTDGWGRDLRYKLTTDSYELRSAGPDGRFDTRDDIVFAPELHSVMVRRASGCYDSEFSWFREGRPLQLILDTGEVRSAWYAAGPELNGVTPQWRPLSGDSLWVRWNAVAWRELRFRLQGDTLTGVAMSGEDTPGSVRTYRVSALRAACRM